jgi:oligosaccharide reducing-end xylanase
VRVGWRWLGVAASSALLALASCTTTIDSIGYNGVGGIHLRQLNREGRTYPNPFRDDLNKSDADVANKIAGAFAQLFHGDPTLEAIYVPMGTDQAVIQDTLHNDVRTEGIGLGMMIAIQLDKRTEFDKLWTFAIMQRKQKVPPRRGYFESRCDTLTATESCDDPYGESQMVMALIFAHDRWGSTTGPVNYEEGAVDLLTVMRHKQDENGGIVGGITDTFDATTGLPFDVPLVGRERVGRPSIVMPAYYDLWAEATEDPFWTRAAVAARDYWKRAADPGTGLMPVRANFDGKPYANWENFQSESYRAHVNMALDWAWAKGGKDAWEVAEADTLLAFFTGKGMDTYGKSYHLDGMPIDPMRDLALVAVNGVAAMVATRQDGFSYMSAVWDMATPTGPARYYAGILDLTALLILSGQYVIW